MFSSYSMGVFVIFIILFQKFFVRCLKQEAGEKFVCSRNQACVITKETRTQCQHCRFQKCISLGMYKPGMLFCPTFYSNGVNDLTYSCSLDICRQSMKFPLAQSPVVTRFPACRLLKVDYKYCVL